MSPLRLSSRLFAFVFFCLYLSALSAGLGQEPFKIKFRVVRDKIVVPVTINGAGPFDFLVDTGDTDTIIDRKLAEELYLLPTGKMILTTTQGEAVTDLVDTDSLSMQGAIVRGLKLVVVNHFANILPNVRGSLGEDFLRNFDFLIDNQRHLLQLESEPGSLADMLTGEHLALSLNGLYEQKVTRNRLVVVGNIFGNKDITLQLDSGTPSILLFSKLNKPGLISEKRTVLVGGIFGSSFVADAQTVMHLRLGGKTFSDLTVLVPAGNMPPMDIDGILPTSLFRSIFISHSGKFVIIDPSTKKLALAQSK